MDNARILILSIDFQSSTWIKLLIIKVTSFTVINLVLKFDYEHSYYKKTGKILNYLFSVIPPFPPTTLRPVKNLPKKESAPWTRPFDLYNKVRYFLKVADLSQMGQSYYYFLD